MQIKSRTAGLLLHPSSFPGSEPIGTLGQEAKNYLAWLSSTGTKVWQILPLVPNGRQNSPYFSWSTFAGNPLLVDLADLKKNGIKFEHKQAKPNPDPNRVNFEQLIPNKFEALHLAAKSFLETKGHPWRKDFEQFVSEREWVRETALFFALRHHHLKKPWWEWDLALRSCHPRAVVRAQNQLAAEIERLSAIFFFFDKQWDEIRALCRKHQITLVGDVPIYVDMDSCEVWLNQSLFKLYSHGVPEVVSGCPPDYFSEEGQLWGNPIYRWDIMAGDRYAWWKARIARVFELTDMVRIDHFRGLEAYWEIPAQNQVPKLGWWTTGPSQDFFDAISEEFPDLPFIAEDLGVDHPSIHRLRQNNKLPGMRVIQFGFTGDKDSIHLLHKHEPESVCYPGTHDNDTIAGWRRTLPLSAQYEVASYFQMPDAHCPNEEFVWRIIDAALSSPSILSVIQLQDYLLLDSDARMNKPDVYQGNWEWRAPKGCFSEDLAAKIRERLEKFDRLG